MAAVLIPVIIHLFRFRRYRKVYFSNLRFIEDLQLETRRRTRLRHLLVMMARMLAIASLVLAFAQPYTPLRGGDNAGARRNVIVFLDNSFSMESVSAEGTLLQVARDRATAIAQAYGPADQFALMTHDFEGRHQRFYSRDEFQELVQSVEISPLSRSLEEVMLRASDLCGEEGVKAELFLISDFQRTMMGESFPGVDSSLRTFLIPLEANALSNLYVDTAWFSSPARYAGQQARLNVRVVNAGQGDYEKVPLRLKLNGEQRAVASLDVPAGQSLELSLSFRLDEPGWYHGAIELTDYPVTYDDRYHLAFPVSDRIPLLAIHEGSPSPYLSALFAGDSAFSFSATPYLSVDYASLGRNSLVIADGLNTLPSGLADALLNFTRDGGSVILYPGEDIDPSGYSAFLGAFGLGLSGTPDTTDARVADLDPSHPLFEEVFEGEGAREGQRMDLPLVYSHYPLTPAVGSGGEVLLGMDNGRPFLLSGSPGPGRVYLFASPLREEWSSLPRHALIVPLLYRMALMSRPVQHISHTIGGDDGLRFPGISRAAEVLTLVGQEDGTEIIPGIRTQGS
ncbi:MAG TPA: BatA and WFA domain-containing protein, partial [Bacteroidales bacterium]|nr:BatA and WFA domain-containing protein [Bacteroidales bacterium]